MEYKILANDLWADESGQHHLFLHIRISNEGDVFEKAERICKEDVDKLVAEETTIEVIATDLANRAILYRPTELAEQAAQKTLELERVKLEQTQAQARLVEAQLELARLQNNPNS